MAELEKTIGHNRKGRKLILNPVNNETTANTTTYPEEVIYTAIEIEFWGSMTVTRATKKPVNIKAMPSITHSMAIMFRLSGLISPNPLITDFVGKRWAMPQKKGNAAPM